MPSCPPPQAAILHQFLCGQVKVGQGHTDPQAGIAQADYTILGRWWEYACTAGLGLGGQIPDLSIVEALDTVPTAGLGLGGYLPQIRIDYTLTVPSAGLGLGGQLPATKLSQVLAVPQAGLGLGGSIPTFVGQQWLYPEVCTDDVLVAAGSTDLVLTAAGETDLVLSTSECR